MIIFKIKINNSNQNRNYQVGLLYDLYANEGYENSSNIPWYVNVHFEVNFMLYKIIVLDCSKKL
jgi:hypothetical protein